MPASRIAAPPPPDAPEEPGAVGFLERAEVRDVLAWMRLLVDPQDAAAVVRALARPPIELRQVHLARVIQLARRRKLDLVSGLSAAIESPQVPPEARERIQRFLELHRNAAAGLDTVRPDVLMGRLIELLGTRARALLAPEDAAEQRASLTQLHELAVDFVQSEPRSTARELARHLTAVVSEARWEDLTPGRQELAATEPLGEPSAPSEDPAAAGLEATLHLMRAEVLGSVARIGGRLGELRLDTDLDISHGVVRYLELLKLAALIQRPASQSVADALSDVNARLLAATTSLEREIFQTSTLDDMLLAERSDGDGQSADDGDYERVRAQALAPRGEHSLGPFLPRKGIGLAL